MDASRPNEFDMVGRRGRDGFTGLFLPGDAIDEAQDRVMAEIAALRFERNAWKLDVLGYEPDNERPVDWL